MEEEGLLPSELADKTSQNRPAITGILDRLGKDRWIDKQETHQLQSRRIIDVHCGYKVCKQYSDPEDGQWCHESDKY